MAITLNASASSFRLDSPDLMKANVMQSLRFTEFGPPSVLRIEEVPIPEPGEGEALVQVKAAAINPSDIGNVAGHFKKTTLPRTPGRDFAGIAVKGMHHEGAEVWGSSGKLGIVHDGSHAEYVVVPAETLSLKPKSLSMAQAAAIGVPYITAWASVVSAAQIQPGETILVIGAAGAVGQAAIQIATWKQARVIGADRRSDPIAGAEAVIDTQTEDLEKWVLKLTAGKGVDAVFDTVGGPMFEPALRSLRFGGRQVAIASPGHPRVSLNLTDFYHNFSRLLGVDSYGLTSRQVAEIEDELRLGFETGALKPPPIEIVPFEKAVDAYTPGSCHDGRKPNRCSASTVGVSEGRLEMKALLISFVVGLLVGVVYGVIRVKSPAPPIVALLWTIGDGVRRASWRPASFTRSFTPKHSRGQVASWRWCSCGSTCPPRTR
jgi:NADPH2:quinone reductase